ncbi:hypothetical protein GMI70_10250 [Eggerthellaceae bacterium zg-893]|nr:hypothetical protein [Eggerthellaceae bacterium zg-893]
MTATKTTLKTKLAAILAAVMIAFGMAFAAETAWAEEDVSKRPADAVCRVTVDGEPLVSNNSDALGYYKKATHVNWVLPSVEDGQKITIEVYKKYTARLEIPKGKTATLNVIGSVGLKGITNEGTLTINGGAGTFTDTTNAALVENNGTLTINGGSFTGKYYGVNNFGTAHIVDAEIHGADSAIRTTGESSEVRIEGKSTKLTSESKEDPTIRANGSSVLLSDGTVTNADPEGNGIIASGSTITINSGTIEAYRGITLYTENDIHSTLNMTGGTIDVKGAGIDGNGNDGVSTDSVINIFGGDIVSKSTGVYLPMSCTFEMTGGSITGATGIEAKLGDLTIKGGTVTGTGANKSGKVQLNSGSDPDGSAITLVPYTFVSSGKSNLKLTITDGLITSKEGVAISVCNPRKKDNEKIIDGSAAIEINGGTFKGKSASIKYYEKGTEKLKYEPVESIEPGKDRKVAIIPEGTPNDPDGVQDVIFKVTRGTYSSNVTDYCENGYTAISTNGGETYSIIPSDEADGDSLKKTNNVAVAKIGNKYYGSVGAAIKALRKTPSQA